MIPFLNGLAAMVGAAAFWTCAALAAVTPLNAGAQETGYRNFAGFQGITRTAEARALPAMEPVVVAVAEVPEFERIVVRPEPRDMDTMRVRLDEAELEAAALAMKLHSTKAALEVLAVRAAERGDSALSQALQQVRNSLS